ncbi:phosphotriesterase-related protein [Aquiflexum balticum DSM 16537]|uniref:Phosphotriesterase-related protein n=1 Tax=Aquiflexum balticum DSM 16537 TaxID=758820 RepID=A0A1W2H2S4_9BACT|nr:aryldialkylphosphatase [Aquiflexum balticum]SMD43247.1 phosphotriesterase-related protein [Aquiflexum balticum DSM 16537]
MKRNIIPFLVIFIIFSCIDQKSTYIQTVSGKISADQMGLTLIHEHILVDFIGADSTGYHRWDKDSVIQRVLPFLEELKVRGVKTIVECTPSYLGKDPVLLNKLTELTGIRFLTNTGYYGAVGTKYLPEHALDESAVQLANRWIKEFREGIETTGIKPGFIKISVNEGAILSDMDKKLVQAAAITHLETGLLIVSHTGTWKTAKAEIDVLKESGVDVSNFVWVHAQTEKDFNNYKKAAESGVWISLDGIAWDVPGHLDRIVFCKENQILDRVLLSHDAGWYSPGEPGGGNIVGYTDLFDELIPLMKEKGFTQKELDLMLIENPAKAFSIE